MRRPGAALVSDGSRFFAWRAPRAAKAAPGRRTPRRRPEFRSRIVIKTPHFCNRSLVSLNKANKVSGENSNMSIDKNKITTQEELGEPAPMDQAEQRVEAEMKKLEGETKREVAEGLRQQDEDDSQ